MFFGSIVSTSIVEVMAWALPSSLRLFCNKVLLNYKGDNKDLEGATVYTTLYPCQNCAKLLAQVELKGWFIYQINMFI